MRGVSIILIGLVLLGFSACQSDHRQKVDSIQNDSVMQMLSGVWLDDNSEAPMFIISNDSITYVNTGHTAEPVRFQILGDTLVVLNSEVVKYPIRLLKSHSLQLVSPLGDLLSLHKSESDSLTTLDINDTSVQSEVIRRDSVVNYQGKRYHGYVYINPSRRKIILPSISEDGLPIDNTYYDNVIHICVYQGKTQLYASDITKDVFQKLVPDDFLKNAILSDMHFCGIDSRGAHFRAQLCIPESSTCYLIEIIVRENVEPIFKVLQ